jgi:NADPH-dependent 2,4-dienoyl-CoA reductase/sulfur reductase-like enzyme
LSKIVLIGWIVRGSQPLTLSFGAESTRSVDYVDVGCIISYNVHVLLLNWILGAKIIIVIHIYIYLPALQNLGVDIMSCVPYCWWTTYPFPLLKDQIISAK